MLLLLAACSPNHNRSNTGLITANTQVAFTKNVNIQPIVLDEFSREPSFQRLKNKIQNKQSLVVHLRIPLCDNDNQGIVPVPKKLGNGFDLRNNLYWGAKYGFKHHFKQSKNWELIHSENAVSPNILERVIFKTILPNQTKVYIVADAYKGDSMKACLEDFVHSIAGNTDRNITIHDEKLGLGSNADLIIFNGHNGLMDYSLDLVPSTDNIIREASVIGCISHDYFKDHFLAAKAYPLLMTTNLMAPEAYVVEAVIESWMNLGEEKVIRQNAGIAYNNYQKCGINGATKLFRHGW